MDVTAAIRTRLEVREFTDEPVDRDIRRAILDAGRLAPSGRNLQHWRFVLVTGEDSADLADRSTTGGWVAGADFAVVVCTDPDYYYHRIDAGRAITHVQFEAWARGVGSCIYTEEDEAPIRSLLSVPEAYAVSAIVGFGHPTFDVEAVQGQKDRVPLSAVVYDGQFGEPL
jgi:nitroreductase